MSQRLPLFLLIILLSVISFNAFTLFNHIREVSSIKQRGGLHQFAQSYQPLEFLKTKFKRIGYMTDKPMEHPIAIAQYQLAQLTLAPSVLELNNPDFIAVIFDYTSSDKAAQRIQGLGLTPVYISPDGIIAAINPKYIQP